MRSVAHCRKWIAPLLAAAMILCGICLDLGQADIVFSRAVQPAEKTTEAYLARTLVSQQESPCDDGTARVKERAGADRERAVIRTELKGCARTVSFIAFYGITDKNPDRKKKKSGAGTGTPKVYHPVYPQAGRRKMDSCDFIYKKKITGGKYIWLRILWQWFCFSSCYARASGAGGWKMGKSDKKETCVFSRMGVY